MMEWPWVDLGGGTGGATPTGLEQITEGSNTGWRLIGRDPNNYGDIGNGAIDLSYGSSASTTYGATGDYSFCVGFRQKLLGVLASQWEIIQKLLELSFASGLWASLLVSSPIVATFMPRVLAYSNGTIYNCLGDYSTSMGSYKS